MRAEIITIREPDRAAPPAPLTLTGVILAGGSGERFAGTDRGLIPVAGRALVKRVLEQLFLQVRHVVIVANRNQALYATYGHRVVSDALPGHQGPLAGVAAGLAAIETSHALFVPVDAARVPNILAASLLRAHAEHRGAPCYVRSGDGPVPACCLVARTERASVEAALAAGQRDLLAWLRSRGAVEVDFSNWPSQFWGVHSPEQLAALEKALLR